MAPRIKNSIDSKVFPQPGPPQISVGRPAGKPPPVISSRPSIPLGHLPSARLFGPSTVVIFDIGHWLSSTLNARRNPEKAAQFRFELPGYSRSQHDALGRASTLRPDRPFAL